MPIPSVETGGAHAALAKRLTAQLRGEVRFDRLTRALYATDASIYEIVPGGVVFPKDVRDVTETIRLCAQSDVPIVPRGAGTGLTGGAVGSGVPLDLSRHMRRIGPVDADRRTVEVEPGVVLDELNAALASHSLMFAPDVATGSRATLGGMIANNSCGARSVRYGRTVDHVRRLSVATAQGDVVTFERGQPAAPDTRAGYIESELARIRDAYYGEIVRRFPKVLRSNGGYGLDRLGAPGTPPDVTKILCGSEGTLGVVVSATLSLTPLPVHTTLVLLLFDDLLTALAATPAILAHDPSAVELVDDTILSAGRANTRLSHPCSFLQGSPAAILAVEFQGDDAREISASVEALCAEKAVVSSASGVVKLDDAVRQTAFWDLRKSGLGLLMSKPGDDQSYAFVEDSAVDPARLSEYIGRFRDILAGEGVTAGFYAHASVGCIHVRPVLNLKSDGDVSKMAAIADAVSDLALAFGGAMTGEHGDGLVRSCWLEKMYGPRIMAAFVEVKELFDPEHRLNPNKIVDPLPMTDHLRYGGAFRSDEVKTSLDFEVFGGMAGMAQMCSGVGQCRQTLTGSMCPSYVATLDETHTTRGRANALRIALSNREWLLGLDDPALEEVMDLCVSCKACKSECPTGVDMARLKSEYFSYKNMTRGVSRHARFVADVPERLASLSRFPRLANVVMGSSAVRRFAERRYGLDRRMPPPRLAVRTFRAWFRKHRRRRTRNIQTGRDLRANRGAVIYFVDTWMNYITPQVGVATVMLLEAAGFEVHCPATYCCGRPAISQGLLAEARQLAHWNVARLSNALDAEVPVISTEPSCLSALIDEYPQLVRTAEAQRLANRSYLLESFLRRVLDDHSDALRFAKTSRPILLHAHCHQKALVGIEDCLSLLRAACGGPVSEMDAGCCGMAGAFGHEVEHYDAAQAIGEGRLVPAIRVRGEAEVAVTGFSCRQQIEHATNARPRHVAEILIDALNRKA